MGILSWDKPERAVFSPDYRLYAAIPIIVIGLITAFVLLGW